MPISRVTCPQASSPSAAPPPDQSVPSETSGEQTWSLFNGRDAAAASTKDTTMAVVVRLDEREPPPQPNTFIDAALYIKLKMTLKVIFVSGWWGFMQQYQFNKLDARMSKPKKRPKRHQVRGGNSRGVRQGKCQWTSISPENS